MLIQEHNLRRLEQARDVAVAAGKRRCWRRAHRLTCLTVAAWLGTTAAALAQAEGTIQGTVEDQSNAVLPGVSIAATETTTGRAYLTTSDARGNYRLLAVAAGTYRLEATLPGFSAAVVPTLEVLIGQNITVQLTLKLAGLEEDVTVTGELPLVDTTSSRVASNVDRRQMEDLPLQGRNWMDLSLLVKGVTANNAGLTPGIREDQFNLTLDGQQIMQRVNTTGGSGQPKLSREAIAEFQIVTALFDVTQGRSTGAQVQAISRAGTNTTTGSVYGYARADAFNARDPVVGRVLPYENQQIGGSLGGPIIRDRLLYFATFEYEREPQMVIPRVARLPNQSWAFSNTITQQSLMVRVDQNISTSDHLTYRASGWRFQNPFEVAGTAHPSTASRRKNRSANTLVSWTRVLSDAAVQELRVGYATIQPTNQLADPALDTTPTYSFPGVMIGGSLTYPQFHADQLMSARYDLTSHRGRHDLKAGAEFLYSHNPGYGLSLRGNYVFSRDLPLEEFERRFPAAAWNNPAAWDLSGLDALVTRFDQNVGDNHRLVNRPMWGIWIGDTWRTTDRLTINYGVRWDDDLGITESHIINQSVFAPLGAPLFKEGIRDHDNVAPRAGFVYDVTGTQDFLLRGGSGLYYNTPVGAMNAISQLYGNKLKTNSFVNDGQPGFLEDPTRNFTRDEIENGVVPQAAVAIAHDYRMPYAVQASIGFQKQLGAVAGLDSDLMYLDERNVLQGRDINLFFDPDTGYSLDPNRFGRPDPNWGEVSWVESSGRRERFIWSSALTRRFRDHFQAGVTYSLSFFNRDDGGDMAGRTFADNQFDVGGEWGHANDFQRHTLRANWIVALSRGFSLAGLYLYGSGEHFATTIAGRPYNKPGANRLNIGAPVAIPESLRHRFDGPAVIGTGEVAPRNALRGLPIHKVDLRLSKVFTLPGRLRVSAVAELFNVFNHENFGAYNGQINSPSFGQPVQSLANTYLPRAAQFGVRVRF